jgi:dUTP pyrophosphatase
MEHPKLTLICERIVDKDGNVMGFVPTRSSGRAAGYDIYSPTDCIIKAHKQKTIPTRIRLQISPLTPITAENMYRHYYIRLAPRSGMAHKNKINVHAGVVDGDYVGEVGVILFNHSNKEYVIKRGDRICNAIIEPCHSPPIVEGPIDTATDRDASGFGSSGR